MAALRTKQEDPSCTALLSGMSICVPSLIVLNQIKSNQVVYFENHVVKRKLHDEFRFQLSRKRKCLNHKLGTDQ